ncbi:pseudaminic acid synthase [Leptospira alstonii]|uniref:pseudaminic acid synthase n=1 Tax=Leptospira alstonii TaxID=28452 RepID=UPI000772F29D|nr:pseudaminic acid synthase [Leptospira alstonii]
MYNINIGNQIISKLCKPFIIAEISGNHNQSIERALEIVDAAAEARVDAIKLQTYTADTITIDKKEGEFFISDPKSLWKGESLYDLYKKAYTPWEWHEPIFKRAKERGILCFSSPFDFTAVDFLESLNVPAYKIASFENIDLPLIRKVAKTGKPVIISTGMASIQEIAEAVDAVRSQGNDQLILLKCTSTYPATPENTNILTIPHIKELFQCEIGLSDHTLGIGVAVASVALGATVIEKHFTLSRAEGGVDSAFSMEPAEMKSLVIETERAWQALGKITYGPTEKEKASMVFRRSLYIVEDMKEGDLISEKNVRSIRPGYGLPPKYLDMVIGKKVNCTVEKGTGLRWEMIG